MGNGEKTCPQCGKPVAANLMGLCPQCLLKAGIETQSVGPNGERERFVPPSVEELGKRFPQLEILELIGRGGMGAVYKARQKQLDRVVALKILPPGTGKDGKKETEFAERFAREARALAAMSHPNIVTLYEFGEAEGLYFFLMEYVDGVNLRQLMSAGKLAPKEALAIVPHVCDALQYAHDRGIVHRDIKPENILIGRDGVVKIADFGVAKILGEKSEVRGQRSEEADGKTVGQGAVGTRGYMAPEQVERPGEVDHRADIYSLGVVLYQMLTGELPGKRIEPPSRKVQIDVRIDEIVLRALEKEPERRYETAGVMKTEVETIAGNAELRMENAETGARGQTEHRPAWHRFVAVVGTRGGKRVVNWPAVVFDALGIGLLGLIGVSIGAVTRDNTANWGLAAWCVVVVVAATIGLSIWLGLTRMPPERLVRLDGDETAQAPAQAGVRYSRTAIIGAVWSAFALIAIVQIYLEERGMIVLAGSSPPGDGKWLWVLLRIAPAVGYTALFGTTILGWTAVSQIRRSMGRLHGMGLAVFDGMVFPLLALDGLLAGLVFYAVTLVRHAQQLPRMVSGAQAGLIFLVVVLPVIVLADVLIVSRVWRTVNNRKVEAGSPIQSGTYLGAGRQLLLVLGGALLMACIGLVVWRIAFYTPPAGLPTSGYVQRAKSQLERAAGLPMSPWVQEGASPLEIKRRLRALGFEYDSYHIEFVDNTNKSIWRFSSLRRVVTNQSGRQTTVPQDGELVIEYLDTGYRIRGSGDLRGLLDIDIDTRVRVNDVGNSAAKRMGDVQSSATIPSADDRGFHDILMPDAAMQGVRVFLNLATGQVLRPPGNVVGPALRYYIEMGKLDLGYDIDLIIFRGGKLLDAQGQPVPPKYVQGDSPRYDVAKLPQTVFVLTGDQRLFELRDIRREVPSEMLSLRYAVAQSTTRAAQSTESPELKSLLKQQLEMAESRLIFVQRQAEAGRIPATDVAAARRGRDVAAAELEGDAVKAAGAQVTYADYMVKVQKALFEAGRIGSKEYQDAVAELTRAKIEYERAKAASPTPQAQPQAATTQAAVEADPAARIRLRDAELRLARVEEVYKANGASPLEYEQAKLERDIAAAEVRGDPTEVARLKLEFAVRRLRRVEELYKAGAASPLELDDAKLARDIAAAELRGDRLAVAQVKYEYAERRLEGAEELYRNGVLTPSEIEQTKSARDLAKIEYERVKASKGSDGVPSTQPAGGNPFVKRQRFEPKAGMENQTNWGVMDKPSIFNPEGWAIVAHMAVGGVVPARLPGETKEFCRIKMLDGNDDQITLQVEDVAKQNAMTVRIGRDQYAEIMVNGNRYRMMYPAVDVAVKEADTTPLAMVIVTHADQKQVPTTQAAIDGKSQ